MAFEEFQNFIFKISNLEKNKILKNQKNLENQNKNPSIDKCKIAFFAFKKNYFKLICSKIIFNLSKRKFKISWKLRKKFKISSKYAQKLLYWPKRHDKHDRQRVSQRIFQRPM